MRIELRGLMARASQQQKVQCMTRNASANAPNAMRYQANMPKPWRLMKRTNGFTTSSALRNAVTKPSAMMPLSCPSSRDQFL